MPVASIAQVLFKDRLQPFCQGPTKAMGPARFVKKGVDVSDIERKIIEARTADMNAWTVAAVRISDLIENIGI
jgi:hypothetical protein